MKVVGHSAIIIAILTFQITSQKTVYHCTTTTHVATYTHHLVTLLLGVNGMLVTTIWRESAASNMTSEPTLLPYQVSGRDK